MALRQLVQPKLKKSLTQEISSGFGLIVTGGPKPGTVQVPEGATFYAPLVINDMNYVDPRRSDYSRGSPAVLRRSKLRIVGNESPRFESPGFLSEFTGTNKCTNYNANPDVALTGVSKSGDAAAVLRRVEDVQALRDAGLDEVCSSGFVIELDNSAGSTNASVQVAGPTGNTVEHIGSAHARNITGTCSLGISGGLTTSILSGRYQRYSAGGTPSDALQVFEFVAPAGAVGRFILNGLEQQWVSTSPIITEGASGTRDLDKLIWPLINSLGQNLLNDSQGWASVIWTPGFSDSDIPAGADRSGSILQHEFASTNRFVYYLKQAGANYFVNRDSTVFSTVVVPGGFVKDRPYLIVVRWVGAVKQIGFKTQGAWAWSIEDAYVGAWPANTHLRVSSYEGVNSVVPHWIREVLYFATAQSTAQIEAYFADVMN